MLRRALKSLRNALMYPLPESWSLAWWCVPIYLFVIWYLCRWFVYLFPSTGVAVTWLAGMGILISIKTSPTKLEKIVWLILCVLLIRVELQSIRSDRAENQYEQLVQRMEERQSFEKVTRQERTSFLSASRQENEHFQEMLNETETVLSIEQDLKRTDAQRFSEAYSAAGVLTGLASRISMENPDSTDNLKGHFRSRFFEQLRLGNKAKANEIMDKEFPAAKKRVWDRWQIELNHDLPQARKCQSELLERLPNPSAPPTEKNAVATLLQTGILSRDSKVDSETLRDTAAYLRTLANAFADSAVPVAKR